MTILVLVKAVVAATVLWAAGPPLWRFAVREWRRRL